MNISKLFEEMMKGVELPSEQQIRTETKNVKRSGTYKGKWTDESYRDNKSKSSKEKWAEIENDIKDGYQDWINNGGRQELSEITASNWKDPEFRAKMLEIRNTDESRKKNSERAKQQFEDPTKHHNFKGVTIGTHIKTGEEVKLLGYKEIKNSGFNAGMISECIKGNRKSHKGYTWRREPIDKIT